MQETTNIVFPNNCRGTSMKFVEPGKSNLIFVCGEYYGRYEDDDFYCWIYDLENHEFYHDGWTTRGACSGEVFDKEYVDLNDATEDQLNEIREAAKVYAINNSESILSMFDTQLKCTYYKSYSRKTREAAFASITENFPFMVKECDDIAKLVSLWISSNYYNNMYRSQFLTDCMTKLDLHIKTSLNMKPRKVYALGEDFTGEIFWKRTVDGFYGQKYKMGLKTEDGKTVWCYLKLREGAEEGETITVNGTVSNTREDEKYGTVVNIRGAIRIDNVDPELIVRETVAE